MVVAKHSAFLAPAGQVAGCVLRVVAIGVGGFALELDGPRMWAAQGTLRVQGPN